MAHTDLVLEDKDEIVCFCGGEMTIIKGTSYIIHYPKCTHCGRSMNGYNRFHVCQRDKKHNKHDWLIKSNHEFGNASVYNHILCRQCRKHRINQDRYWTVSMDHYEYFNRSVKND